MSDRDSYGAAIAPASGACGSREPHEFHRFNLSNGESVMCYGVVATPLERIAEALERIADALEVER